MMLGAERAVLGPSAEVPLKNGWTRAHPFKESS